MSVLIFDSPTAEQSVPPDHAQHCTGTSHGIVSSLLLP